MKYDQSLNEPLRKVKRAEPDIIPQRDPKSTMQGPVISYAVKTRQGYIPGQKKTNQDSFVAISNFSGIKDHWMMGVCDGHGV